LRPFGTIPSALVASFTVLIGMWLERFLIVVPSLANRHLPYSWGSYRPQPPEIMIMIATFAAMGLLYMLFAKLVPIISIWELKVGNQPHPAEAVDTEDEMAALWRARP
jgi:molybdopterin-containing oxidoreductase family membrane subunit